MVENDNFSCPLCGSRLFRRAFKANRKSKISEDRYICTNPYLAEHGDILQCLDCFLYYNVDKPSACQLLAAYSDVQDFLYLREQPARRITFQRSLNQLHRRIKPPGRMLDIGCYTGVFMEIATAAGWQVSGVELSSWAAGISRGLNVGPVFNCQLHEAPLAAESFDVITLWDVIEHLLDPASLVRQISHLLKPGGILALDTYFLDSVAAKLLQGKYPFLMDMHMIHFTRPTIMRLLQNNGFESISWHTHQRTLSWQYLIEKLTYRSARLQRFMDWPIIKKPSMGKFVNISCLGLRTIFAVKSLSAKAT